MQRLEMRTGDAEILDPLLRIELPVEQSRRILDKLQMRTVELRKSLLILALHHHLGLGAQRALAKRLDVLDPDFFALRFFQAHPRLTALRMRHTVNSARVAGMLRQFRR